MVEAIVAGAVQPSSSTPAEMHVQKGNQNGPADVQLNVSYVWGQKTASGDSTEALQEPFFLL